MKNEKRWKRDRAAQRSRKYLDASSDDSDIGEGTVTPKKLSEVKGSEDLVHQFDKFSLTSPAPHTRRIERKTPSSLRVPREELFRTPSGDSRPHLTPTGGSHHTTSPFMQSLPDGALATPRNLNQRMNSLAANAFSPVSPSLNDQKEVISEVPRMQPLAVPVSRVQSKDAIAKAIFQFLFTTRSEPEEDMRRGRSRQCRLWDDVDSSSDDEDEEEVGALPKVPPVDEQWFHRLCTTDLLTSAALDFACARSGDAKEDFELSNFVGASFVSSLTKELPYEDDRFSSPRVSILKAIYRNCPNSCSPLRHKIITALLEAAHARAERCRECVYLARKLELEANTVANHGLLMSGNNKASRTSLEVATDSIGGKTGQWGGGGEERPSIKVRDRVTSILELLKYTIIVEMKECKDRILAQPTTAPDQSSTESFENNSLAALRLLLLQQQVAVMVLSCYGGSLGLPKGGESSDEPAVLEAIAQCLSNILLSASNIPAQTAARYSRLGGLSNHHHVGINNSNSHGHSGSIDSSRRNQGTASAVSSSSSSSSSGTKQSPRMSFTSAMQDKRGIEAIVTLGNAAVSFVAEELLKSLVRLWPSRQRSGRCGAGYHAEIAFLKIAEIGLAHAIPVNSRSVLKRAQALHRKQHGAGNDHGAVESTPKNLDKDGKLALHVPSGTCAQVKCLQLIIHALGSTHFKISLQAFTVINSPRVMSRYFVDLDPHNCLAAMKCHMLISVSGRLASPRTSPTASSLTSTSADHSNGNCSSSIIIPQVCPVPITGDADVVSPLSPLGIHALSEIIAEGRHDILEVLVTVLRSNRSHWHPQVQASSNLLFDWLLDYLD